MREEITWILPYSIMINVFLQEMKQAILPYWDGLITERQKYMRSKTDRMMQKNSI